MERPQCPVVFLDIDGVLNRSTADARYISIEEKPAANLKKLLHRSGARLVLSTSWRKYNEYISHILVNFGVLDASRPIAKEDRTPSFANSARRDLEILRFLQQEGSAVSSWVVLDDLDLLQFPTYDRMKDHVIQVDPTMGLTSADVDRALEIL